MAKKPQQITAICDGNSQLKYFSDRSNTLNQLNSVLHKLLPEQLRGHCRLANINTNSIVIQTDSSQFASLLRFDAPRICKAMTEHLTKPVSRLKVTVNAELHSAKVESKQPKTLSTTAAQTISEAAEFLEDGDLKKALNKLAKRHQS
jgi:hypothetical protein